MFLHCFRQYMEELIEYIERTPKPGRAFKWKQPSILSFLPAPLKDAASPNSWRKIYTKQHLQDAISRIHPVAFNVKQVKRSKRLFKLSDETSISIWFYYR